MFKLNVSLLFKFQATQIYVLFKNLLSNQQIIVFQQLMETLELWKNQVQKMNTNPKVYELTLYSKLTSFIPIKLFIKYSRVYFINVNKFTAY